MVGQTILQREEEGREENDENEDQDYDMLANLSKLVDDCLIRGSHTTMQWLLDKRTYGLKVHYNETAQGCIDWMGHQIRYKKVEFTMEQLRGMVGGMIAECGKILKEKVLVLGEMGEMGEIEKMPRIPWSKLSIKLTSGAASDGRNIFIENAMVCTVTGYHKGYSTSGDVKVYTGTCPDALEN